MYPNLGPVLLSNIAILLDLGPDSRRTLVVRRRSKKESVMLTRFHQSKNEFTWLQLATFFFEAQNIQHRFSGGLPRTFIRRVPGSVETPSYGASWSWAASHLYHRKSRQRCCSELVVPGKQRLFLIRVCGLFRTPPKVPGFASARKFEWEISGLRILKRKRRVKLKSK